MARSRGVLIFLLFLCCSSPLQLALGRNVHVDVKSSGWPLYHLSFIAEQAESVAQLSSIKFWQFIDNVCGDATIVAKIDSLSNNNQGDSGMEIGDLLAELQVSVLGVAENVTSTPMHTMMSTMVGIGAFTPAVRFSQSLTEPHGNPCNGNAFMTLLPGGHIKCGAADDAMISAMLSTAPNSHNSATYNDYDHNFASDKPIIVAPSAGKVVLNGLIGTSSFCSAHAQLSAYAGDGLVRYSVRHAFLGMAPATKEMNLQGYGVFLDIKNMEYKNFDDSAGAAEGKEIGSTDGSTLEPFPEGEEVDGVDFSKLLSRRPDLAKELAVMREELLTKRDEGLQAGVGMKVWRMRDLGLQALLAIASAASHGTDGSAVIAKLADIAHNFPARASAISSIKVSQELRAGLEALAHSGLLHHLHPSSAYINGIRVDIGGNTFNVYDFLDEIKKEIVHMEQLASLEEVPAALRDEVKQLSRKLSSDDSTAEDSPRGGRAVRIDVSRGAKSVVTFMNNLEKDQMYKRWPKSLRQLLFPSWSLQTIAKNMYTLIVNVDPLTFDGVSILMQINMMWQQQWPVRFGAVLAVTSGPAAAPGMASSHDVCRLFALALREYSTKAAVAFLVDVSEAAGESFQLLAGASEADIAGDTPAQVTRDMVVALFAQSAFGTKASESQRDIRTRAEAVLADENVYADFVSNSSIYLNARGLAINSFSLNGIVRQTSDMQSALMQILGREQYLMTSYYQNKKITDKTPSLFSAILQESSAFQRYHPLLEEEQPSYVDFAAPAARELLGRLDFYSLTGEGTGCGIAGTYTNTTIIVARPNQTDYLSLAEAFRWLNNTASAEGVGRHRLALALRLPPSLEDCSAQSCPNVRPEMLRELALLRALGKALSQRRCERSAVEGLATLFLALGAGASCSEALEEAAALLGADVVKVARAEMGDERLYGYLEEAVKESRLAHSAIPVDASGSDVTVIYNSRKVSAGAAAKPFHELDFDLVASIEHGRIGAELDAMLARYSEEEGPPAQPVSSEAALKIVSFCGMYGASGRRTDMAAMVDSVREASSSFAFDLPAVEGGGNDDIVIHYVLDPLSLAAQRAPVLMQLVQEQLRVKQVVVFLPKSDLSEFPLQNFYRYVLSSHDQDNARATFRSLPRQHTLTVRIDAPEPWNIQASSALQDIDNLRCDAGACGDAGSRQKDTTEVSYTLKNMLVVGQCFETGLLGGYQPPNGLQLVLGEKGTIVSDTLVMQNLGYYQLQAGPGLYRLALAQGKASELYDIQNAAAAGGGLSIAVKSFSDASNRLLVKKKPGMEGVSLLEDSSGDKDGKRGAGKGMFGALSSMFGGKSAEPAPSSKNETMHIFSLATGHMYERLLRIMMLSVTKRTSSPVKFWLFENYLSPTFKASAAAMAEEYGFEVAYVTYKWPEWLTQQTSKQRIIWGYKILFLDVLFPLGVKKVIYVDADQVVRADLKELWDMDLQGRPYGYTPFCDSREETLGFQFWRKGYWADHLRGKPYHISALYVVDLQVFRRYAVGDQLRAVYDGLAKDPNSLSNLDQDLPNYAQHSVPIFSLPQEWLWCETWCADKTKAKAKTIDLCNSPLLKEPKLDMARRIISGGLFNESWIELDLEIKALEAKKGLVTLS